jgi:hypothetical protein
MEVSDPLKRPAVSGQRIRALRHAREIVDGMRWRGIAVPQLYANMAGEFQALVLSGHYAAWLAAPDEAAHEPADGEAY